VEAESAKAEETAEEESPPAEGQRPVSSGTPDPEQILKAWQDYTASVEKSQPRVFSTLASNRPEIGPDGSIRLRLNSEAQRDNFIKNIRPELSRYICRTCGLEELNILTEVVEQEENGKKIYTDQDKLEYLMKLNPGLGEFKNKLNLDFDN
jgi:DNA polymerase-3 subunit gamma/tau